MRNLFLFLFIILSYSLSPPEGDQFPTRAPPPPVPCRFCLTTPSQAATPLHRCPVHAGLWSAPRVLPPSPWPPTSVLFSPRSQPSWPMLGHTTRACTPAASSSLLGSAPLARLCACPLHPLELQVPSPGHNHPTCGLSPPPAVSLLHPSVSHLSLCLLEGRCFHPSWLQAPCWGFHKHPTCPSLCRKPAHPNTSQWGFNTPAQAVQTPSSTRSSNNTCAVSLPLP